MLHDRDYILRLIEQAGRIAARLRALLTGSATPPEDIAIEAREAQAALLGSLRAVAVALDAGSAVTVLGAERVRAWATLLEVEAAALRSAGDEAGAATVAARARSLAAAANGGDPR